MPPPFLPGNGNLESICEPEIAKSLVALQSHCLEMSCSKGLCQDAQKGTEAEPKAWERIAVQGELVPAEEGHILVDSMFWLVRELLWQVSCLWDIG